MKEDYCVVIICSSNFVMLIVLFITKFYHNEKCMFNRNDVIGIVYYLSTSSNP